MIEIAPQNFPALASNITRKMVKQKNPQKSSVVFKKDQKGKNQSQIHEGKKWKMMEQATLFAQKLYPLIHKIQASFTKSANSYLSLF